MIMIVLHVQLDARSYSIFDRAGTSAGAGAGTGTGAGTGVPVPVRGGGAPSPVYGCTLAVSERRPWWGVAGPMRET